MLLYGAGALAVPGGVFTTLSVLITVVVATGMLWALIPLCPPRIWLRGLIAAVLVVPLVGTGALHARRTSHARRSGSGLSAAGGGPPGPPRG